MGPLGKLQPSPKVCGLGAPLHHLGGEVADEFCEVFRVRGLLADFTRTFPRRLPRVTQSLKRVYIHAIGFLYAFSFDFSLKDATTDVCADGTRINPECFRGDLRRHPPGRARAISAYAVLSHEGILETIRTGCESP